MGFPPPTPSAREACSVARVLYLVAIIVFVHLGTIVAGFVAISFPNVFRCFRSHNNPWLRRHCEGISIPARGRTLAGLVCRGPDNGRAVLLLHGRSNNANYLGPLVELLSPHVTVVGVDFRGHGGNGFERTFLGMRERDEV